VSALAAVEDVPGRDTVARLIISAEDEAACRLFVETTELIWTYHRYEKPVKSVSVTGEQVTLRDIDDGVVLPLRVDYLTWTLETEALADSLPEVASRSVWLSGAVSERTRIALEARGIAAHERVFANRDGGLDIAAILTPDRATTPRQEDAPSETRKLMGDIRDGTVGWMNRVGSAVRRGDEKPSVEAHE
jgi:hypothetical protein